MEPTRFVDDDHIMKISKDLKTNDCIYIHIGLNNHLLLNISINYYGFKHTCINYTIKHKAYITIIINQSNNR